MRPYASWVKICVLILLFVLYRDYLSGEPAPFMSVNLEMDAKSSIARDVGRFMFPVIWFGSLLSILLSPFLSVSVLRIPLTFIFLFSWMANTAILKIAQGDGTPDAPRENIVDSGTLSLFWAYRHRLLDTINTYSEMVPTFIAFALIVLVFAWTPSRSLSVRGKWNIVACLPIAMVAAMAIYSKGGTSTFPTPVGFPIRFASAIVAVTKEDKVAESFHARAVTMRPEESRFEKIILIMDESVRAGFVDSKAIEKLGLIDYGATVSTGNCSHFARFVFKRGFQPADLPKALVPNGLASEEPTVWQYAKSAGFKTVYIDALGDAVLHDGINSDELSYVDEKFYIHSRPTYTRDFEALKRLYEVMSRPGRIFVVVDKQGAHHPYQDKYPPNEKLTFEGPAVKQTDNKDLREYQRDLLERYNKTIDWTVNKFLSDLFAHGVPDNTFLIYTSDHGQSLVENNTKWTHCSSGASTVNGEGLVPLLVYLRGDTPFAQAFRENGRAFRGKYSQFQLFSTMLLAMGYPASSVAQSYGSSLLDPPPPTRQFLKGGNVRQLEWHTVD